MNTLPTFLKEAIPHLDVELYRSYGKTKVECSRSRWVYMVVVLMIGYANPQLSVSEIESYLKQFTVTDLMDMMDFEINHR